jgi:hypothetical protein
MAAVNLVTATTINRITLYQGQPTTSATTLYTVPAATTAKIASIVISNTTGTAATITLDMVPSGGTTGATHRLLTAVPVPANATTVLDSVIYMSTGDFIAGLQGTSSALTVTISGETYA